MTFPKDPNQGGNADPRPDPEAPLPIPPKPRIYEYNVGPRTMIRCCLPNIQWDEYEHVRADLERRLRERYGGFTRYPMVGGWVNTAGEPMAEDGYIYEVSFRSPDGQSSYNLHAIFADAGWRIGEEWVHIERHDFSAAHVKVTP